MQIFLVNAIMQMTGNKIDILYCGRSRFLLLEKFFLSCLNYNRSQSPSQRQWVCDENTEDKVLWLVASVGKVVLCESLSSTINIIPSCDNDNYAQETRWSCPGHWSATHTIIHYWTSSTHWMTFYLAEVIVDVKMYLPVPLCPQTWSTFEPRPLKLESPAFPAHR